MDFNCYCCIAVFRLLSNLWTLAYCPIYGLYATPPRGHVRMHATLSIEYRHAMYKYLFAIATLASLAACATGPITDYAAKHKEDRTRYEAIQATRTNYAKANASVVSKGVTTHGTKFDSEIEYVGPVICQEEYPDTTKDPHCDNAGVRYSLVSLGGDRNRIILLANFVYHGGNSWAFYKSASLAGGSVLKLGSIKREVGTGYIRPSSGYLSETVQVMLPTGYPDNHLSGGFDIRFNAERSRGKFDELHIPAEYIKGFLSALPK